MKIVRFLCGDHAAYGIVSGDTVLDLVGDVSGQFEPGDEVCSLDEVTILPPCEPTKVVAVGLNYYDHAKELGMAIPEEPILFIKPPTSVIGHGAPIVYPAMAGRVDYEAELAVIIGKVAKRVPVEKARAYILGYTAGNDVTARDLQKKDGQWTRSKSFDTFCPLGPYLVPELDGNNLSVQARLNGNLCQSSSTANLIFSVGRLVSFVSHVMTLLPGDVILTGTPSGIGPMKPGDVVEIEVEGVGTLRNPVIS